MLTVKRIVDRYWRNWWLLEEGKFLSLHSAYRRVNFTGEGIWNLHNLHHWSDNPHNKRIASVQDSLSRKIVGPHLLPNILNGENYLKIFRDALPVLLLEEISSDTVIVFQHDRCRFISGWTSENFWIILLSTEWQSRWSDLTPLDFYVWSWV